MADFSTVAARRGRFSRAAGLIDRIRATYGSMAAIRDELALYQAGTDAELVEGVNAFYTAAQRTELGQIGTKFSTLATDLETNHASAIEE